MNYDWAQAIREDAAGIELAAQLGLSARIPGCPDWNVRDLVHHLGQVHRFHAAHVTRGVVERMTDYVPGPLPEDADLLPWFEKGVAVLIAALDATAPETPAWNWAPHTPQIAAFWRRRMALETAVHRWDAQSAHDIAVDFDLALADDGIGEMLTVMRVAKVNGPDEPLPAATGTVVVHVTDAGSVWSVCIEGRAFVPLAKELPDPDAVVEGTATQLLLALWGRRPLEALVDGDLALAAVLR